MEENQKEQNQASIFGFQFDDESKSTLKVISQWASIIAIISFVSLGVSVIAFFMQDTPNKRFLFDSRGPETGGVFYLVIQLAITLLLNILLYNTSVHLKKGIELNDQGILNKGFATLRTYYKTYGIVIIVLLSLMLLAFLFVIFFAASFRGF